MFSVEVIFSDTKEARTSLVDSLRVKSGFIELENVRTYVYASSFPWSYLQDTGLDFDGDLSYLPLGIVYFDAVDKIAIKSGGKEQIIFEKHY